ncbi:MAG: hypothetical protein GY870_22105, partial [archaeon]|nr:hypothetical protein [archaeon]
IPALSPGSYSFQINYNDSLGQVSSDTAILTVEDVAFPVIDTRPDDLIINEGDLSQSFVWNATDTDPDKYNITRDGTIIVASGTWSSGDDIVYNIPALSPGSYSFQINYNDSLGQVSSDTAILTVEDNTIPVITVEAVNKTLVEGFIDEEVNWTVTDLHPNTYFISINGTINVSAQVWSSGTMIVFDIPESLKAGLYLITLNISDESGNSIENTIFIMVEVKSTGNNNGNNGDLDYLMTFIIIAAISIVFLVLFRSFGWRSISKKKIGSKLNSFLEQPGIGQSTLEHTTDNVLLSIKEQNSVIERANLIIPTMDLDIEDIPEEELFD